MLPEPILAAAVRRPLGGISIIGGAGCSFEDPTNIPLSRQCSEDAFRQLVLDGMLLETDCVDPTDLSKLADVVFAKFGTQQALVERLPINRFRLLSVELGEYNEGVHYALRKAHDKKEGWLDRIFRNRPAGYTFHIDPRDEAGGRILTDMRNRGILRTARALAQSADHVLSFFKMLRNRISVLCGLHQFARRTLGHGNADLFPHSSTAGRELLRISGAI